MLFVDVFVGKLKHGQPGLKFIFKFTEWLLRVAYIASAEPFNRFARFARCSNRTSLSLSLARNKLQYAVVAVTDGNQVANYFAAKARVGMPQKLPFFFPLKFLTF